MKTVVCLVVGAFVCSYLHGAAFIVGLGVCWVIAVIGANST